MADRLTVARPYAKAAFARAQADGDNVLYAFTCQGTQPIGR